MSTGKTRKTPNARSSPGTVLGDAIRRIADAARDAEVDGPKNVVSAVNVGGVGRATAAQRQQVVHIRRGNGPARGRMPERTPTANQEGLSRPDER